MAGPKEIKSETKQQLSSAGVSDTKMQAMMPPEKVTGRQEFDTEYGKAVTALQMIRKSHRPDVVAKYRMSEAQIEDVISGHEKAYPEFGKTLRTAHEDMGKLGKDAIGQNAVLDRATKELFGSYKNHSEEFKRKNTPYVETRPQDLKLPNQAEAIMPFLADRPGVFMATPKNIDKTYVAGISLLGLLDKNPGLIAADKVESALKSYDEAYPELGKMMRETYADMKKTGISDEQRHEAFDKGLTRMLEFREKPTSLNVDPGHVAEMVASAQKPGREPLPETFARAHDNNPDELKTGPAVTAEDRPLVTVSSGMRPGG